MITKYIFVFLFLFAIITNTYFNEFIVKVSLYYLSSQLQPSSSASASARNGSLTGTGNLPRSKPDIYCYYNDASHFNWSDSSFPSEKLIFFLESSCKGGLTARQACAVESAARANPDWTVVVMLTGAVDPARDQFDQLAYRTMLTLTYFTNVKILKMNVLEFTKGTQLEGLFVGEITRSLFPIHHASDALRILLLNKYGGIYLDLDVIVIKSFNSLPKNFVVPELINDTQRHSIELNGVIGFENHGVGKEFTDTALYHLKYEYFSDEFTGNGPELIHVVTRDIFCKSKIRKYGPKPLGESLRSCRGIHLMDKRIFFPVPLAHWYMYYDEFDREVFPRRFPRAYAHHVWNHMAEVKRQPPRVHRHSLYARLARKYCPRINHRFRLSDN